MHFFPLSNIRPEREWVLSRFAIALDPSLKSISIVAQGGTEHWGPADARSGRRKRPSYPSPTRPRDGTVSSLSPRLLFDYNYSSCVINEKKTNNTLLLSTQIFFSV